MFLSPTAAITMGIREASPSHFQIKIESYSLFGQHTIDKYETGEFTAGGYKWRLIIYPNEGITGKDSEFISIYLAISGTSSLPANWEVNAVFSIFLFNQISCNYLYSLGMTRRFLAMKPEWGFSNFIPKKVLTNPLNGYLVDNNCVFGAEVFVVEKSAVSECLSLKYMTAPYRINWQISNFSKIGHHSGQFTVGGYKWAVLLHPNGWGGEKGRSVSIYLRLHDSRRVMASYSVRIKNQVTDKHLRQSSFAWFSASHPSWGWTAFADITSFKDPNKGFIVKDCCLLEIEIFVQAVV